LQARLGRTSADAVEVGAGVQTGIERAREVADGERSSTQSSGAADVDAAERDSGQSPGHGSVSGTASADGGGSANSGSTDVGRQEADSGHQQIPELFAPGRLLYIRKESGADNWLVDILVITLCVKR
jgi:hypothetical protein